RPRARGRDRERPALGRVGRLGRALPPGPRLPRGRLGARDAADGRLRRKHRRPRRPQPRVEARVRARRPGRRGAARHVRRRAPADLGLDRRAGVHPLRPAARSRPRQGEPRADRRRPPDRPRLPLPLGGGARRGRRRRPLRGPERAVRPAGNARGTPPARRRPLDDRPLRAGVRAPRRRGMEGRGRGAPRAPGRGQGGDARPPGRVHRVADGRTAGRGGAEGLPRPDPRPLSVDEVQVLVVGGSLVGLSTAVFLATHGLHPLVVERHAGTAIHPRAAHFQQRTLELYRSVGLEAEILAAAEAEFVQDGAIMSVETLAGRELEWYFRNVNEGIEALTPSRQVFITQRGLEPILRRRAEELGVRLEYSAEVVSLEQDADGVTAVVRARDGGAERRVRASYVVAADGSRSPVRERLGIRLLGHAPFSRSLTIYFRADAKPLLGDRNLSVVYVFNPEVQGFLRFELAADAGFFAVSKAVDAEGRTTSDVAADASEARCVHLVRAALGVPDLPVEIENVQPWNASAEWAERFREGRILLAGDAAHAMPPNGGF